MSRRLRHPWVRSIAQLRQSTQRPTAPSFPLHRRLHFEPLEDRRLLSTITVNTLIDVSANDGLTTLREAIAAAMPNDTIDFSVTGTINLSSLGQLTIDKNLTINGPGASLLTIRGFAGTAAERDGARIFRVDDGNLSTFKDVSISALTLTGGDVNGAGGAIFNASENLSISACTISLNHAVSGGGLHNNGGHLSISGSTISVNTVLGSGAGIETAGGSLNVAESTISGNSAPSGGSGGGIHSSSSIATIDSSTISGNSANYGGGVNHVGTGSGILMTITNSTISGNSARRDGGGVSAVFSDVIVRHSSITLNRADSDNNGTGNGGGVFVNSVLTNATIDHTIVAGNLRQVSTRDDIFGSVIAASAFNLVGVNTGLTGISNGMNGNQIGTASSPIDPLMGPLANNGGPTMTHQLLTGSPAIEAGDPAAVAGVGNVPPFDQRGAPFARVADRDGDGTARIDIGGIERQSLVPSNFFVDVLADEDDDNYTAGDLSLREAILLAEFNPGVETITFAPALTSGGPATILLTHGELAIRDAMTIDGPGANLLTIDASGNDPDPSSFGNGSRVFRIDDGSLATMAEVAIISLRLILGDTGEPGGAIFNAEQLSVTGSTISGNVSLTLLSRDGSGGGIYNLGNLTVSGSTISNNFGYSYDGGGGGIANISGNVVIDGSTIRDNTSSDGGGGIFNKRGSLTVTNSTISGNDTNFIGGGGIYSYGNTTVTNSTIRGNSSGYDGGGIRGGSLTVINTTISGNETAQRGGGIFSNSLTVVNSTISGNSSPLNSGGGIFFGGIFGNGTVRHSTITGNTGGSGIRGTFTLDHSIVAGNSPSDSVGSTFVSFSLIGVGAAFLGPLADNGGPTMTHALLPGSPAIDAGDPAAVAGVGTVPQFDQRGFPFTRAIDGDGAGAARIDIGAFELHLIPPTTPALLGDYNLNDVVDAADYVLWRKTIGTGGVSAFSGADGNGNGEIDQPDHGVWTAHFGETLPPGAGSGAGDEPSVAGTVGQAVPDMGTEAQPSFVRQAEPDLLWSAAAPLANRDAAARAASFAVLETHSLRQDPSAQSRGRNHRYALSEPGGDDLPLLLAIDRVWRSPQQDSFVNDDSGNGEHRDDDDDSESEIDEPLAVALAVGRGARSTYISSG